VRSARLFLTSLMAALALCIAGSAACVGWLMSHSSAAPGSRPGQNVPALTRQQQISLYQAEQAAFGACLRAQGFQYWPVPQPAPSVFQLFPYVIDNVAWASSNGFGDDQASASARMVAADPNTRYIASLSPSRRQALGVAENGDGPHGPGVTVKLPFGVELGHSTSGCTATAEGILYGSFPDWFRAENVADSLSSLWQADVASDPRFAAAVRHWSRCMHDRNEPYASPGTAAQAFTSPVRTMPNALAIRVATAEAECARATDLAATARALNAHYQHIVEVKYRTVILTFRTLAQGALTRAPAFLGRNRSLAGKGQE
jgi:hypothetical protein